MAYYNSNIDDEEVDPNAPQAPSEAGTIEGQGSGAGNTPPAAAQPPTGSPGGHQFAGIQQYIQANKPQSAKLARDVSGYVSDLGNQARSQLESGQQNYNKAVEQNTIGLDQELLNKAKENPNEVVGNQGSLDEFKRERDAQYKGPNSFETSDFFKPVSEAINKATTAGSNTANEVGQKQLLGQVQQSKRGKVNQGALAFDAGLLQADPGAKGILAESRKGLEDIPGRLTSAEQAALAKSQEAAKTTDATKSAVQGAFTGENGVQTQFENQLRSKAADAVNQSKTQTDNLMAVLKSGATPNDAQLGLLGVDRNQWNQLTGDRDYLQNTYGVNPYSDLSTYATAQNPEVNINAQNIASADDYARYAALNQLMGTNNDFLSNPSLAGKANLDNVDFNYGGASGDIKNSIQLEKQRADQRAAEEAAARARADEEAKRKEEDRKRNLAAGIGAAIGGPIGGIIGGVFCFLQNTPILMADGSHEMVQNLKLGDETMFGGAVMAHGVSLCLDVVEYEGRFTSSQHAIFDGQKFVRACNVEGGKLHSLDKPIEVYPVVTQYHFLVSDNGVVYADLMEVDVVGVSDADKLTLLNTLDRLEAARYIEKEIQWTSFNTEAHTTMH